MITPRDFTAHRIQIEIKAQAWIGPKKDCAETIDTHLIDAIPRSNVTA